MYREGVIGGCWGERLSGKANGSSCPAFVPGIHVLLFCCGKDVDGRVMPGHDEKQGRVS
jgi:hypothetical protein